MAFTLPEGPSVAVLPFVNMSGDPEQEYFSDGLTENIITGLSGDARLFVIARNSTFTYKGKSVKVQEVAHELGAQYVVEGSVQKATDRVRITVQLINANTGHHIWADKYDRDLICRGGQCSEGKRPRQNYRPINQCQHWTSHLGG
jgi:adenylate cyclase